MKCGLDATLSVPRNSSPNDKSGRGSASVRSGVPHGEREVYLEFLVVGDSIKVVAVDAASGTEVSITGSVHAPKAELEKVAMDKLRYVMGLKKTEEPSAGTNQPAKDGGKGWVV